MSRDTQCTQQNRSEFEQELGMAALAAAMSDVSRMKMLCALMDGRAWTATELSIVADVAPSTTSAHLSRLLQGKLITCLSQGRHRYFRLFSSDIAELIETLMGVSWQRIEPPKSRTPDRLKKARTCYDHLAGEVAVDIYDFMVKNEWMDKLAEKLTPLGKEQLERLGVTLDPKTKRKKSCACLDWSERKFHLGGYLGAELFNLFERKGWIIRAVGFREVAISRKGRDEFKRLFNIKA